MLLACMGLCRPLWDISLREWHFPVAPVVSGMPNLPAHYHRYLFVFLLVALFFLMAWPRQKWVLGGVVLWLTGMCVLDVNRLQPWVWMSILVFGVVWLSDKDKETEIFALRLLMAGIYFWSGFNKITPYFVEGDFIWFLETFAFSRPVAQWPVLGYGLALFELFFAFGLLWQRSQRMTAFVVIGFHLCTVFYLGPLGRNWNQVVIPWNLGMAVLVYVLFLHLGHIRGNKPFWSACFSGFATVLIVTLVWLAPVLHFFGGWPHGLSWELYTNTQTELTYYKPANALYTTKHCDYLFSTFHFEEDRTKMLIEDWALNDLKVPQFVAERSLMVPARQLCQCSNHDSAGIYVLRVHRFDRSKEELQWIPCSKLK